LKNEDRTHKKSAELGTSAKEWMMLRNLLVYCCMDLGEEGSDQSGHATECN
jgi:hypothetical protein